MYNKRIWLNPTESSSTGSIVAFHGPANYGHGKERNNESFLEVSDCHNKIRLHRCKFDSREDFIKKIEMVRDAAAEFAFFLKNNNT